VRDIEFLKVIFVIENSIKLQKKLVLKTSILKLKNLITPLNVEIIGMGSIFHDIKILDHIV
jgi:hypothetical protein